MPATYSYQQDDVPKLPSGAFAFAAAAVGTFTVAAGYPYGATVTTASTGDLTVQDALSGTAIALTALPAYYTLPFRVRAVNAGGTAGYLASF